MKPLLPIMLFLLVAPVTAQQEPTYRIVHPDGSVEFTDEPRPGAEEYLIEEPMTFSMPPVPVIEQHADEEPKPRAAASYEKLEIIAPNPEETVRDARGNLMVAVSLQPGLAEDHELVILVDGEVRARGRTDSYLLTGIHRGAHTVTAQVRNSGGRIIISAKPVTVYVHQPSVRFPNRETKTGSSLDPAFPHVS